MPPELPVGVLTDWMKNMLRTQRFELSGGNGSAGGVEVHVDVDGVDGEVCWVSAWNCRLL